MNNEKPKIIQGKPRYFKLKIPQDWNTELLGNLFTFVKGKLPKEVFVEKIDNNLCYLTSESLDEKSQNYVDESDGIVVNDSDIIMLVDGEGSGRVYTSKKGILASTFILFKKIVNTKIDSKFVFYYLHHNYQFLRKTRYGTGIPHVDKFLLKNLLVPIPPTIEEQQKIASILSNIDMLIQKQKKIITQTQRLKKIQTDTLLTKGIGHSNLESVTYGLRWMIEKFPSEWIPTPLGELCEIRKKPGISSDSYVGLEHIEGKGSNNLISKGNAALFASTNTFKKGDILYGKLRPYLNKIWLATESGYCSTDILPLIVNKKILNIFLLHVLTSKLFLKYAISTSAGTKMPRTEWSDMKKFKIVLPPTIEEQQKIASILSNLHLLIQQEKQYKEKLEKIKRGLMQQLLTGQKRVKV